jgi:hypothetical protein
MSTKTTADKLLIKPGSGIWLSHADRLPLLGPFPEGVHAVGQIEQAATAVIFPDDAASLQGMLAGQQAGLAAPGTLWVAYPKGNKTDINRDSLWPMLTGYRLRPIAQVAVDDTWSALRFRPLKPGEESFTGGRS